MDAAVPVNEGVRPTAKRGRQQREVGALESHCSLGLVRMAQSWGKQFDPIRVK